MFCRNLAGGWWMKLLLFTWNDIKDLCWILGIFVTINIIYNTKFTLFTENELNHLLFKMMMAQQLDMSLLESFTLLKCHNFSIDYNPIPSQVHKSCSKIRRIRIREGKKKYREQLHIIIEWNVSGVRLDSLIWWAYELIKWLNPFEWFCFRFDFEFLLPASKFVTIAIHFFIRPMCDNGQCDSSPFKYNTIPPCRLHKNVLYRHSKLVKHFTYLCVECADESFWTEIRSRCHWTWFNSSEWTFRQQKKESPIVMLTQWCIQTWMHVCLCLCLCQM